MNDHEIHDEEVVDLGAASIETKGTAVIDQDPSGGQLRFHIGIAQD